MRIICLIAYVVAGTELTYADKTKKSRILSGTTSNSNSENGGPAHLQPMLPDLKPATSAKAAIRIDGNCNIQVGVENIGSADAVPSKVSIKWMNQNGNPAELSAEVPLVPKAKSAFQPGFVYSVPFNANFHSINANVPFTVTVDSTNNMVAESNESNNVKNFVWEVGADGIPSQCVARPDLIINKIEWKYDDTSKVCSLEVTSKNVGVTNLNGQSFYVNVEGIVNASGQANYTYATPSLEVNQEATQIINNFTAKDATTSTVAFADKTYNYPTGNITELNENNNQLNTAPNPNCVYQALSGGGCDGFFALHSKNDSSSFISKISIQDGTVLYKQKLDTSIYSIACAKGIMYGIHAEPNFGGLKLKRISTETGQTTEIGPMNFDFWLSFGATEGGNLIGLHYGGNTDLTPTGKVVILNPETMQVVKQFDFQNPDKCYFGDISSTDGNIHYVAAFCAYSSINNVRLYRINTSTEQMENLGTSFIPSQSINDGAPKNMESYSTSGQDFFINQSDLLYKINLNPLSFTFKFQMPLTPIPISVWNFAWDVGYGPSGGS